MKISKPAHGQSQKANDKASPLAICALFGAMMGAVYCVQEYADRERAHKGMEASSTNDTCLQEQFQLATVQDTATPLIHDIKAAQIVSAGDQQQKTCPDLVPPVS